MNPLDAQWLLRDNGDHESVEGDPRFCFGQEAESSTWLDIGFEHADVPSDLMGGHQEQCLAVRDTWETTVDPQELALARPNGPEMGFSGDDLAAGFDPFFPEGVPGPLFQGESGFFETRFTAPTAAFETYPDSDAGYPAGEFIPVPIVFPVAFSQVSHASDE